MNDRDVILALAAPEPELVWRNVPGGMREVTDWSIRSWQDWHDLRILALERAAEIREARAAR